MNIKGVIIEDSGMYFGFMKDFPGVCAQANSPQEVSDKINTYFKAFMSNVEQNSIEFDYDDVKSL